jgi:hypothetical protein
MTETIRDSEARRRIVQAGPAEAVTEAERRVMDRARAEIEELRAQRIASDFAASDAAMARARRLEDPLAEWFPAMVAHATEGVFLGSRFERHGLDPFRPRAQATFEPEYGFTHVPDVPTLAPAADTLAAEVFRRAELIDDLHVHDDELITSGDAGPAEDTGAPVGSGALPLRTFTDPGGKRRTVLIGSAIESIAIPAVVDKAERGLRALTEAQTRALWSAVNHALVNGATAGSSSVEGLADVAADLDGAAPTSTDEAVGRAAGQVLGSDHTSPLTLVYSPPDQQHIDGALRDNRPEVEQWIASSAVTPGTAYLAALDEALTPYWWGVTVALAADHKAEFAEGRATLKVVSRFYFQWRHRPLVGDPLEPGPSSAVIKVEGIGS